MSILIVLLLGSLFAPAMLADVYSLTATIYPVGSCNAITRRPVFNGAYYLADRSNACVHVISLPNCTQNKIISGFHTGGVNGSASSDLSRPNGLVVLPNRNELYVRDRDWQH
jgi:hypothetical protein